MKTAVRTLTCTSSLHVSGDLGQSAIAWMLDRLNTENPTPRDFVTNVDLLNRSKVSRRCRQRACDAVNKLAPMCHPGKMTFWTAKVDGLKVWSDLRPNEP